MTTGLIYNILSSALLFPLSKISGSAIARMCDVYLGVCGLRRCFSEPYTFYHCMRVRCDICVQKLEAQMRDVAYGTRQYRVRPDSRDQVGAWHRNKVCGGGISIIL